MSRKLFGIMSEKSKGMYSQWNLVYVLRTYTRFHWACKFKIKLKTKHNCTKLPVHRDLVATHQFPPISYIFEEGAFLVS